MDLLEFDYHHFFDILVNDQFRNGMLMSSVSIAEANLLIVVLEEAYSCLVEVLYIVLESDPEYTVHLIIDS